MKLAAGKSTAKCIGHGTIQVEGVKLPESANIQNLSSTLISVGKTYDSHRTIVFTSKEAIVLNLSTFSVSSKDIEEIANRNPESGLYEFEPGVLVLKCNS